jgi:hypothetical protein
MERIPCKTVYETRFSAKKMTPCGVVQEKDTCQPICGTKLKLYLAIFTLTYFIYLFYLLSWVRFFTYQVIIISSFFLISLNFVMLKLMYFFLFKYGKIKGKSERLQRRIFTLLNMIEEIKCELMKMFYHFLLQMVKQ